MAGWISLKAADGHTLSAWMTRAEGRPLGAVVVLQEVFGVNRHIRWVCEQFSANGFDALAPCLFDRVGGNVDLDYTDAGIAEGRRRVAELAFDTALLDVDAAKTLLARRARVAAVGYCWGGTLAFLANTRLGMPAVSYYGARSLPYLAETVQAPILMHFGRHDPLIPQAFHDELAKQQPDLPVHFYDAGHGFNCNERADFHAESAALAWRRSLRFLREALASDGALSEDEGVTPSFELDARLERDTIPLLDLPLCQVLLMNDSRYPWLILVPRIAGLREILELDVADQQKLMAEVVLVQQVISQLFEPEKLNVGALGNVVSQLHIHVLGRFSSDAAWPGPVWGQGSPVPYAPGVANALAKSLMQALTATGPE
ncbi:MAG: dienelactone hydrolase family protein [Ahniella sp.]|nr:dienelactone hydrolase family protein [Ahniella sp.]